MDESGLQSGTIQKKQVLKKYKKQRTGIYWQASVTLTLQKAAMLAQVIL